MSARELTVKAALGDPSTAARLSVTAVISLAALIALLTVATLWFCDGHFVYSLDDPYISLALGWQIGHGHYGLNPVEPASPSSSILYPVLLALFSHTPLYEWVPLVINSFAAVATAACFASMLVHYSIVDRRRELARGALLLTVLSVAINLVGLVFTGLEHSLHVLASVLIIYGLARALEEGATPPWLVAAIVLAPLLRFEGLALSALAIVSLLIVGQLRGAIVASLTISAALGVYVGAMILLGLPPLPSSVLIKAPVFASGQVGILGAAWKALSVALNYKQAFSLGLFFLVLLAHPALRAAGIVGADQFSWKSELLFVTVAAGAVLAHVMFGSWGWWYRYEIYVLALTVAAALVVWRAQLRAFITKGRPWQVALAVVVLLAINLLYVRATILDPLAGRGVYEQQYQLHRFAVEFYHAPVAANDIGWLSYDNPNYVLDLWGLGSETARKARLVTHRAGWMSDLVESHHVGLAMIYAHWFRGDVPTTWQRIATMRGAHISINGSGNEVSFYATTPAAVAKAVEALSKFKQAVGSTVDVTLNEAVPGQQPF
jgi:hypothetical protein